jgi:hypothetical protein
MIYHLGVRLEMGHCYFYKWAMLKSNVGFSTINNEDKVIFCIYHYFKGFFSVY